MEDYKKLVNRLREEPKDSRKAVLSIYDLCVDAATAIENLSHRLDMAQGERDAVTRHMIELESNDGQVRKALHDKGFDNLDMLFEDYSQVKNELASYKNTGLEPEEIDDAATAAKLMAKSKIVSCFGVDAEHIRDLIQAEQDGRLHITPAFVWHNGDSGLHEVPYKPWMAQWIATGTKFWLTREEAEAALALKGGEG